MSKLRSTFSTFEELKKYADNASELYISQKEKEKEFQAAHLQLLRYVDDLNNTVSELKTVHKALRESHLNTIYRLAAAAEYRNEDTGDHIVRISRYSALIAEKLELPNKQVQNILYAAPMHDVGKIGIPDSILLKPGKLTKEEFDIIKAHTTIGAKILGNTKVEILQIAEQIALNHHEKWNGKGYPRGLAGNNIPIEARIVGLVDVFDALTSQRPYEDPHPLELTVDIIKEERGEHFDPSIVDVFLENIDQIRRIKTEVCLR